MGTWDCDEPTTSELRAPRFDDENPQTHRSRRSTKRWCRGKKGVEHELAIRLSRYAESLARYPFQRNNSRWGPFVHYKRTCGWSPWFYTRDGDWTYRCAHEQFCVNCGRIFPLDTKRDCPEYDQHPKPQMSAEEYVNLPRDQRPEVPY